MSASVMTCPFLKRADFFMIFSVDLREIVRERQPDRLFQRNLRNFIFSVFLLNFAVFLLYGAFPASAVDDELLALDFDA